MFSLDVILKDSLLFYNINLFLLIVPYFKNSFKDENGKLKFNADMIKSKYMRSIPHYPINMQVTQIKDSFNMGKAQLIFPNYLY